MATFLSDTFTDTEGTLLTAHTGEVGATWTLHPSTGTTAEIASNRVRSSATNAAEVIYYASGIPVSADYDVEATCFVASVLAEAAVAGRVDTATKTMYFFAARPANGDYVLAKSVNGALSFLGSAVPKTFVAGESVTIKLGMRGDQLSCYVGGTMVIGPFTDASITAAGRAGVKYYNAMSDTTGIHIDSITAATPVLAQFARPTADVTDGTWTDQAGGVSLFAAIDEDTASDADYIESAPATLTADVAEIALGTITDPAVSTGHIIRYRYGKNTDLGDVVNMTVSLRQGTATEIAAWTHADIPLGPTTVAQTLTAEQADAITDYTALRLRLSSMKG